MFTFQEPNFRVERQVVPLKYDYEVARNPERNDELISFIKTWYKTKDTKYSDYLNMVTEAVMANNIQGIYTLWRGISYHDRATGDFKTDLYTALRHSNIQTVLFTLNQCAGGDINGEIPIKKKKFLKLAKENPHENVRKFADELCQITFDNPLLVFMIYLSNDEANHANIYEEYGDIYDDCRDEYCEKITTFIQLFKSYLGDTIQEPQY